MSEPDFHAHYHCSYCHALKAKADIVHAYGQPLCRHGNCIDRYLSLLPRQPLAAVDDLRLDI